MGLDACVVDVLTVGGSLPFDLVARVIGLDAIDESERDGAISVERPPHALIHLTAARSTLAASDYRKVTRAIADALRDGLSTNVSPAVAVRLAMILRDDDTYLAEVVRRGARSALLRGDPIAATDLCRFGLSHDPTNVDLLHFQSMALESLGRHGAATGIDSSNAGLVDPAWLGRWASNLFLSTGRKTAAAEFGEVRDENHEMKANLAWIHALEGNVADVATAVNEIIDDPRSSAQAVVWACVAGAFPAALEGRSRIALTMIDHCKSLFLEIGDELTPFAELQIGLIQALTQTRLGNIQESLTFADAKRGLAESPFFAAVWSFFVGIAKRELGDFGGAHHDFAAGFATVEADPFGLITWAQSEDAVCQAMQTDSDPRDVEPGPIAGHGLFQSCLLRNAAWVRAAHGNVDVAVQLLDESVQVAEQRGQNVHMALALMDLARFGEPRRALSMLTRLSSAEAPILRGCAEAIEAIASQCDALIPAARNLYAMGMNVQASELAHLARHNAERSGDLTSVARLDLFDDIRLWPTPIFVETPVVKHQLTEREREIARLCATVGHSRDIADALGISHRTVDNLLGRVYSKCAFHGRAELTAWIQSSQN